jgi:hypothetical protein
MAEPPLSEADLAAILARAGLSLTQDQVRAVLPGAEITRELIERVRAPLPREAEPAVIFRADQGR